jgi:hypothetical protein
VLLWRLGDPLLPVVFLPVFACWWLASRVEAEKASMLRRYCSKASAQKSRYASPASVIEYTRRAGPPLDVSHSDSHRPSLSMFLKVLYSVPGFIASNPNLAVLSMSSYP